MILLNILYFLGTQLLLGVFDFKVDQFGNRYLEPTYIGASFERLEPWTELVILGIVMELN